MLRFFAIAKMLVNNKKDIVEINQEKSVSFLDILCSRHHVISSQNQLQVVEKLFTVVAGMFYHYLFLFVVAGIGGTRDQCFLLLIILFFLFVVAGNREPFCSSSLILYSYIPYLLLQG